MKLCLIINTEHHWQESVGHGLLLVQEMAQLKHEIESVFFYGQAIKVIQEPALAEGWLKWQNNHPCHLWLCRTLLERHNIPEPAPGGFKAVGMASWVTAMDHADRTLEIS